MAIKKPFIIVPLILILGGGVYWWQTHKADSGPVDDLVVYGNVDIREVRLSFNASEHIDTMTVDEGDRVKKGQLLAQLHIERLTAQRNQAKAQYEAQKQVVARLHAGTREEEIREARAALAAAQAKAVAAEKTWKRLNNLARKKLASREDADVAEASFKAAKAEVKSQRAALDLAIAGPRVEDIAAAEAELQARQAAFEFAEEALKDAYLYAPADGVIRERILEPGDMVSPQTPVFTLALTDPVWVRAYLPETVLGRVKIGMAADISTDSYPDKRYRGWVGYISPTAEFTPKTVETPELRTRLVYRMRVYACNPEGELRLGMPATVHIDLRSGDNDTLPGRSVCDAK